MRSKCACGWDREKDLRHTNEVETAASRLTPLASVNFNGDDQPSVTPIRQSSPSEPRSGGSSDEPIVRIWGARPYQPNEDNDMEAREHWRKVTTVNPQGSEGRDVISKVLGSLHGLNAGHGPGLPSHLPVSLRQFEKCGVKKICCGERVVVFLTETSEVYTMGVACHGELGLGEKIHMTRVPKKVTFPKKRLLDMEMTPDDQSVQSPADAASHSYARASADQSLNFTQSQTRLPDETEIIDIACGAHHVLALSSEGLLYVWGDRRYCGLLTLHDLRSPTLMDATLSETPHDSPNRVVAIGAGYNLSVAIKVDGSLFFWGALAGLARCASPKFSGVFINANECNYKVACGRNFGLILQGDNVYQFGYGTMNEILQILPEETGKDISAGGNKSTDQPDPFFKSALDKRSRAFCPQWISGRLRKIHAALREPADIAAGEHHAMVLARNGSIYTWGSNQWGQCGMGSSANVVRIPSMVATKIKATKIAASARTSGFIDDSGRLYLWGCSSEYRLVDSSVEETLELPLLALTHQNSTAPLSTMPATHMGVASQCSRHDSVLAPQLVMLLASYKIVQLAFGPDFTVTVSSGAQSPVRGT